MSSPVDLLDELPPLPRHTPTPRRTGGYVLLLVTILLVALFTVAQAVSAQGRPPTLTIYSGAIAISGAPAPDGLLIRAQVRDYISEPRPIIDSRYQFLIVHPPDDSYNKDIVTFTINEVRAVEYDVFIIALPRVVKNFDLTFPTLPQPTPTATPVPPTPTKTPQVTLPSAYTGEIIIAGGTTPPDSTLVARVGGYESLPAFINGNLYTGLVLDPRDLSLVGGTVEFILNGFTASNTGIYQSGTSNGEFDLIFVGIPTATPTPVPTDTPAAATATPTATPTFTPTSVPPTETPTATLASARGTSPSLCRPGPCGRRWIILRSRRRVKASE